MTANTALSAREQSPLARLITGKPEHIQDGHPVVTLRDPRCPLCGGDLALRRVEVREVIHALVAADVYDGGLGLTSDIKVKEESQSDECQSVQSDQIVCGRAYTGCEFTISGNDLDIDWV